MRMALRSLAPFVVIALGGCIVPGASTEERRANIDSMAQTLLERLYAEEAGARVQIEDCAGYAIFSDVGVDLLYVDGGGGFGVVIDNETDERTYMRMYEEDGVGPDTNDFRAVFVFRHRDLLDDFVSHGWESGAASARAGGTAAEAIEAGFGRPGISVYQLEETGLALRASLEGTRYWPFAELNH